MPLSGGVFFLFVFFLLPTSARIFKLLFRALVSRQSHVGGSVFDALFGLAHACTKHTGEAVVAPFRQPKDAPAEERLALVVFFVFPIVLEVAFSMLEKGEVGAQATSQKLKVRVFIVLR